MAGYAALALLIKRINKAKGGSILTIRVMSMSLLHQIRAGHELIIDSVPYAVMSLIL